jgi:hypothetical protein
VLIVGDPIINQKIRQLYKDHILGGKSEQQQNFTKVEMDKTKHNFGNIKINESKEISFQLKNTGTCPLIINHVSTSCGCITVEWDKQPVSPEKSIDIKMKIKFEEEGYLNKMIYVYCNTREIPIKFTINGIVHK